MSTASELMANGLPQPVAIQLGSQAPLTGLAATGSTKADSFSLLGPFCIFSLVGSGQGCNLQACAGSPMVAIVNGGTNTLLVYSDNTTDVINAGSAGTSFSVAAGKTALFWPAGNTWAALVSA